MSTKYSEIRKDLKTGDIVLFSGKGGISAVVKWFTSSRWSHVGMVLKLEKYDFVTLWESTTLSNVDDLDTKKPTKGVQLVPLSARVDKYSGELAVRRLEKVKLTANSLNSLKGLRNQLKGREYEKRTIELIKSAYDGLFGRPNEEDLSSLFCSELVAEAYQCLGLLTQQKPSNEYTPADFSAGKGIKLIKGNLSPEIMIEAD